MTRRATLPDPWSALGVTTFLGLVSAMAACGGAPFTTTVDESIEHDAGRESAAVDGPSGGAEGSSGDGGIADDAAVDADAQVQEADAPTSGAVDSGCLPEDPFIGGRPYACPSDLQPHTLPVVFAWDRQGNQTDCGWWPTPAACQCATTYTCECLKAAHVCEAHGAGTWQGCNDTAAPAPEVTCQ